MPRFLAALPVAAIVLALLVPALPAQAVDGPSWSVAPADTAVGTARPNFDYAVDAGQVVEDAFLVRNDGATTLTLNVYAADAFTTREGNIDLLAAGEVSVDAGTWVSLPVSMLTLAAGESSIIPFTLAVPTDAQPGDHSAGIVASLTSNDPAAEVQVDRRLGSRMYIRVGGELSPAVEATGLTVEFSGMWNPWAVGSLDVSYQLANTGDTRITALSSLSAAGPLGAAATTTGEVQLPEVLPGSAVEVRHQLSGVGALLWLAGAVSIAPSSVGIGAAQLDAIELDYGVAAIPATVLLVLLVLAILVVLIILVLRARRRATATVAVAVAVAVAPSSPSN
ncbi:MAG: hypothetical protein JWQ43_1443 [Glaciihabitans sp.]|nr:hypothetical protein [Glaciihabitans sp.]